MPIYNSVTLRNAHQSVTSWPKHTHKVSWHKSPRHFSTYLADLDRKLYWISTRSRPDLDQISTKSQAGFDLFSTKSRPILDQISTKSRPNLDQISTKSQAGLDLFSTKSRPIFGSILDTISTNSLWSRRSRWLVSGYLTYALIIPFME